MSRLAVQAELDKLSQTLDLAPEQIEFLRPFPAEQLRGLRVSIYEMLLHEDADVFARMAAVVARVPAAAAAAAAVRGGPIVAARLAAELPARRVVEIATRLTPQFGADVVAHLDPRRTRSARSRSRSRTSALCFGSPSTSARRTGSTTSSRCSRMSGSSG